MIIDTKTGTVDLFEKQIIAFDSFASVNKIFSNISFKQDYHDLYSYDIEDELIIENYIFKVTMTFKSNILWTISIYLTEKSLERIFQEYESFREKLNTIKSIYILTLKLITRKDNIFIKGNIERFNWGFISLERTTSKWPHASISYDYNIIKSLIN
jgi:hypothetical protein